ncbi:MAG: (2E,6E)-farnesyl diphosphate synthase [Pontibacterium sp.]
MITEILAQHRQRVEHILELAISPKSLEPSLQAAMRYGLLNGGKRVRPALVYLVNALLDGKTEDADAPAAAIECIHSYSLIHDDLPAMDDDDLRRGLPTCHIRFDEASAILAGDALQCSAFEILSTCHLSAEAKIQMIQVLSKAAGERGMVLGQAFDLQHENKPLSLEQLESMHNHKTGALLTAAIHLGAISAGVSAGDAFERLTQYGDAIGLAFQVQDDILDVEGDTHIIGKPQGSDQAQNKPTYPAILGMEGAKQKLADLHAEAYKALEPFGNKASQLLALADFIVQRDH